MAKLKKHLQDPRYAPPTTEWEQLFSDVTTRHLGRIISEVGHHLRQPPDPLPIPEDYKVSCRTTWKGRTATLTIGIDGISVQEVFQFDRHRPDVLRRLQTMAVTLWGAYLIERGA